MKRSRTTATLWTARPTPANMAGFGAAPPSASVVTVNVYNDIQPSPPTPIGSILTKDVRL
jgi:hypothetical protein